MASIRNIFDKTPEPVLGKILFQLASRDVKSLEKCSKRVEDLVKSYPNEMERFTAYSMKIQHNDEAKFIQRTVERNADFRTTRETSEVIRRMHQTESERLEFVGDNILLTMTQRWWDDLKYIRLTLEKNSLKAHLQRLRKCSKLTVRYKFDADLDEILLSMKCLGDFEFVGENLRSSERTLAIMEEKALAGAGLYSVIIKESTVRVTAMDFVMFLSRVKRVQNALGDFVSFDGFTVTGTRSEFIELIERHTELVSVPPELVDLIDEETDEPIPNGDKVFLISKGVPPNNETCQLVWIDFRYTGTANFEPVEEPVEE